MTKFSIRRFNPTVVKNLTTHGVPEPLARALAARGVKSIKDLQYDLKEMIPPDRLKNCLEAGKVLADAILENKNIVLIGDYDCDGATACAVGVKGLGLLGAKKVSFLIPDREKDGYGLCRSLVEKAIERKADVLVTVDNGISAYEAVDYAKENGLQVIVTDHHLPGEHLPNADWIVNPNQPGDEFESKSLAGVGVIFYVLLGTRIALREKGAYKSRPQPNLLSLIDLVALGTVADVVPLDKNNRIIVTKGLEKIRNGKMQPGLTSLLKQTGRNCVTLDSHDLAFVIAPRINAAGRIADISCGVNCLISPNYSEANKIAMELDQFNKERQKLQESMQEEAVVLLDRYEVQDSNSICLYEPSWHAGIVGLLAAKIKDRFYRPTIAFAASGDADTEGLIRGSGRSISGIHMRDVLVQVAKKNPGLILKFGGHALAAGLTIKEQDFKKFKKEFELAVSELAMPEVFEDTIQTDGELSAQDFNLRLAHSLKSQVWGSAFPEPIFANRFRVLEQTLLKERHLRLKLEVDGIKVPAIWFRHKDLLPEFAYLSYRLNANEWMSRESLQLIIEGMEDDDRDWA